MLFNSYIFIFLFLPLVVLGYYGLNRMKKYRAATAWLVVMSMWFYGYNSITYLLILVISILCNFGIVKLMTRSSRQTAAASANRTGPQLNRRRFWLFTGILLNLGILFYFKYYDFFIDNVNSVFKTDFPLLRVVLPLGISFYTFQQLSYVIDSYRGACEGYSFLEYAAYVSFFPQLIAGPIVYHSELIPQLRDPADKKPDFDNLSRGLYAFSLGLAKKVLIADTFSKIVGAGYGNIDSLNSTSALLVMICYSLQIYFDFSGYCDMAYGIGYMLNIRLPFNFNSPYKAESISDFWDRWHMTLTRFFTRYVYIPLGGSRRGAVKTYVNIMIVFLVSGLWHGANWTFILWGALHGILKVLERLFKVERFKLPKAFKVCFSFLIVTFLWSLFRADSIAQAAALWERLFLFDFGRISAPVADAFLDLTEMKFLYRLGLENLISSHPGLPAVLFTSFTLLSCFFLKNTQEKTDTLKLTVPKLLTVVILMFWGIISLSEMSEFLYFNF